MFFFLIIFDINFLYIFMLVKKLLLIFEIVLLFFKDLNVIYWYVICICKYKLYNYI